jgi:serine/threonine protein kinase
MFVPEAKYDLKADVWSLGIVAYQMVTGELPLEAKFKADIPMAQRSLKPIPIDLSDCFKDLITRMLAYEPSQRISFDELFTHPFISPPADQVPVDAPLEMLAQSSDSSNFEFVDDDIKEINSEGESPLTRSQNDIESVVKSLESELYRAELVGKVVSYVKPTKEVLGLFALTVKRTEMLKFALDQAESVSGNYSQSLHPTFYTAKDRLWQAFLDSLAAAEASELELISCIHRKGLPASTTLVSLNCMEIADFLLHRYGLSLLSEASVDEYAQDYASSASKYSEALELLDIVGRGEELQALLQEGRKRLETVKIGRELS